MKIIDAHIHTTFAQTNWSELAKSHGIDFSEDGLIAEMKKNNVEYIVSLMDNLDEPTPIGLSLIKQQMERNKHIIGVVGINPYKTTKEGIKATEEGLIAGVIKGIKIYAGYYPFYPSYHKYFKFYKMAEKYNVPVIIHCGDATFRNALLKYAHPLEVDEVAVRFPKTNFVIAHIGNPWTMDAAEVAYKNENVYVDLSGLATGKEYPKFMVEKITNAIEYIGDPNRILYGSDWPLVNMKEYIAFIRRCVPSKYVEKIFYLNAKKLFNIK